ncbi:hypothetical protein F6455_10095 [Proteobacteria bacterium 005FR1]|nr:hypothetical protein [Proteobacteria bacterium 005FR1]
MNSVPAELDSGLRRNDACYFSGDWRLATGDWRLATGDWRLKTGSIPACPQVTYRHSNAMECNETT